MILMRVFLCSDTYLLRSCDHHAVCVNVERSEAAHSSFLSTGVQHRYCHCGALSPYGKAACPQTAFGSTLELVSPFQIVTKDLDKWSEGLDWLGTLSNQIWQHDLSSKEKIFLSSWLLASFCDHDLRKLPQTASLSEKITTRLPSATGSHNTAAMSKANISSSWIMFFCSSLLIERRKSGLTRSLKKKQLRPELS